MRFKANEVSVKRVREALVRRVRELPHAVTWYLDLDGAGRNRRRLGRLEDRHAGETCVIMGNGPSLGSMDLSALRDVVTFGLNRIYLLFDTLPFVPTYFVAVNDLVVEQWIADIAALPMKKFLNWNHRTRFDLGDLTTHFVKPRNALKDVFSPDVRAPLCTGGTVTFVALQLAYFMGFSRTVLIGVDHNFKAEGVPNTTVVRDQERDRDHFRPDYFPKGFKWQPPDLRRSELAFALAREAFEQSGREIFDATVGGKCQIFEKREFSSIF